MSASRKQPAASYADPGAGRAYSVFLAGPPGAGKSTAAAEAARRLGLNATDLDTAVENRAGLHPAELIRVQGEPAFRARELEALKDLGSDRQVVALGGGTLTQPEARAEIRERGVVVGIDVPAEVVAARLSRPSEDGRRPLLPDASVDEVRALFARRARAYAAVDRIVDGSMEPERVAEAVAEATQEVHVVRAVVGSRSSRVVVGRDLIQSLVGAVAHLDPRRPIVVVADLGIPAATRAAWIEPLKALGPVVVIEGPGGEAMKTWTMLGSVLERALNAKAGRQSVVVGIGGGATCDLAGMTAALLGRGAPLVLVPSSLLAQVDASVGGKAAVNAGVGRNLIGAFHAANDVLVDPTLLDSLPVEEVRSGLAELFKTAALFDEPLFAQIAERPAGSNGSTGAATPPITGPHEDALITPEVLARAVRLKADVVARDPYEKNERRLLNFGHTLAHGIETASDYHWRHGDAVAVGMAAMTRWAVAEGWMDREDGNRLLRGLETLGLPAAVPQDLLNKAVSFLGHDKKADGEKITVVTLKALAQPSLREISLASVRQAMIQYGGEQ